MTIRHASIFSLALAGLALCAMPRAGAQDLYVSDFDNNQILEYTGNGALVRTFNAGGLFINPNGLAFSGNSLFVSATDPNTGNGGVYRYNLSNPTAAPSVFATDPGGVLNGLTFGGGNLYAADGQQGQVLEFNGATGAKITAFGSGALANPTGLAFNGTTLFVSDNGANDVVKYSQAGVSQGVFVATGAGGLQAPGYLTFDSGGSLYVASGQGAATAQNPNGNGAILRFNGPSSGTPGTFQSVFSFDNGLASPYGLAVSPNSTFFVGDRNSNNSNGSGGGGHFDQFSASGAFVQSVSFNGGNGNPYGLAFGPASAPSSVPEPSPLAPVAAVALGVAALSLIARRRASRA